jgi:RHH-type transcriptional regulator, proline utilization regulon repressor / proline dehydrogenase / delta 1-pyrroline-5-carboxylate dehydrogenase
MPPVSVQDSPTQSGIENPTGDQVVFAGDEGPLRRSIAGRINDHYLAPEADLVRRLLDKARLAPVPRASVQEHARALVEAVRSGAGSGAGLDAFLRQYHLGSEEGVILMCLAEALLRIPDAHTADRLIADKITSGDWERHLGSSDSLFVNASTWGLLLTGRIVELAPGGEGAVQGWFGQLARRLGEPVVRAAIRQAMRILGAQFVMGDTIASALKRAGGSNERAYRYSFDMLGEAAITSADADRYLHTYRSAIQEIGRESRAGADLIARPSISVKLSALHPRYEFAQSQRVISELIPRLVSLVQLAREVGIGITLDAEEADRLELSLTLIEAVLEHDVLEGFMGFGLAVQAYQRRAYGVLEHLAERARALQRQITVRLVKGAYWDSEIKRAQERGLASYPVFTRKANTDVSYLACVRLLAGMTDVIYPQFATHNAHTVAYVAEVFRDRPHSFEYQRLHGMGEDLYAKVLAGGQHHCRVYAPVGAYQELLPYLVRRMLENGANTSFVNRLVDAALPVETVVANPIAHVESLNSIPHPRIPDPPQIFGQSRKNSRGLNLSDGADILALKQTCETVAAHRWEATALIDGKPCGADALEVVNPANEAHVVGFVRQATAADATRAITSARRAQVLWDDTPTSERVEILLKAADAIEAHQGELIARCTLEAGKTLSDGLAEVREAVDFLRYYSSQALQEYGQARPLVGPTGELNTLRLRGKGVFVCISPWNFPLAIFTGQIAAALVAGNAVIAKPAEQTPLTAALTVQLLHAAGVPPQVLQFLPGTGEEVGAALTGDPRIAGVAFTGSMVTARSIERSLAARAGSIATLIAETGGINAMIADSSALPEQVVLDAVASGFNSAGQRCSALRVLLLQDEIAPRVLELLQGHMQELRIGEPSHLATDVGPVIDGQALAVLEEHAMRMRTQGKCYQVPLPPNLKAGRFFAPLLVELPSLQVLDREVFGPIVHVVRYKATNLDAVIDAINALGYGLTLGVHTRIDSVAKRIAERARVGNVYVNRNIIGAVVGVQPFGGSGLSGTGPKAGGPHYLHRFGSEQTVSTNTSAVGGNASLLSLGGDD